MKKNQRIFQAAILLGYAVLPSNSMALAKCDYNTEQSKSTAETNQSESRKLEFGKPLEKELKGGGSHSYELALTKDRYLEPHSRATRH